ncbi:hypothetical protein BYT27DRAFT_7214560 [Phlegmacium glaucopus]|nr:hypothetical protein BYT27DRAFT_7214560 [Phlegmacium glaucopus]
MQLHSTANLLKLSTVPPNTFKRLSELLRQRLLPLYQVSLTRALQYSTAVLEFIQDNKLIPALNAKDEPLKQLWERLLTSLVSGVLDYLDQGPDTESRESIASILYPILSRIYFYPLAVFLSEYNGGLLSAAYQLLVTTGEPQARNAARLRDHDFLAIESLLDIICTLIPPIKNGFEKRSQFIKEVFDPDLFQCSKSILQILESITDCDWSITAVKIIEALANSDISFPQPFDASSLKICGISVNAIAPFYVDKNGFLANLDQDGKVETLHVPFNTVTRVVGSSINNAEISIVLVLTMPPIIGTEPLSVPAGRGVSVSWHLKKLQLDKFAKAAKDRNLEKIHDMAKCCPSSREQKAEDVTQLAELVTMIVEDDAENQPPSVFLDRCGNLSFTHPVNEAPIEESVGDNIVSALSSTSELPHRLAQRATKNQDDFETVTARATRSNNVAPQIVQKLPTGKPKKKSALTKNSPTVKQHANVQTTTLDAQSHNVILGQGYSAAPIDVDNFHESYGSVPLSKTRKRRSAAAGTMIREVTKPFDEPRKLGDSSLEINIPPVVLKPENKKRSSRNMENSEVIHVSDQQRPTKRARIDPDKASHPALPYQRKKYGRSVKTSSPRVESPAVPTIDFDEIPEPKPTGAVERSKPRVSAMRAKRVGKKMEGKPATRKGKQEHQDVKVDVKATVPKANQAWESFSEIVHRPVEQQTTTGPEMKPDRHPTILKKPPSITQAITTTKQGNDESYARKEAQTTPREDKSLLQEAEGALDPIHLPSTKETLIQRDEISDHDYSLTLLVDGDDYKREEVVEPSTFVPDIVMIDLTQDSPIPPSIPNKVFSKSSLKEVKPMANVQPVLPGRQTQKVKVEILSPHPLPMKHRHDDRPSVSFALPIVPQQYPWRETSTPARKQRTNLDSKSHKIRRSLGKLDHNKATSRGVHQRYTKVEEKKYEQAEEPIERIAEIIKQISETVVHQISRRFDSVRDELHAGHRSILQGTLEHLERMHEESVTHVSNMVQLEEEYAMRCGNILKGFDDYRESVKDVSSCMKDIVKDHNQQSLSKKFPLKLFEKRTGILLNAIIGSKHFVLKLHVVIVQLSGPCEILHFAQHMSPSSSAATEPDLNQYRLPTSVKAVHYDLTIKTDIENLTFHGIAKISLHINAETSMIVFNTSGLELGKATLYSEALKAEQMATFSSFNQTQERALYHLTNALPAGSKAEFKIVYGGKLTGSMMGYYKSAWEKEGRTEHYALTQFEVGVQHISPWVYHVNFLLSKPTSARRAFPCWDEPLLKSTYTITMISRENTVNLSNMPAMSEELIERGVNVPDDLRDILDSTKNDSDKWKITKFETTPLMSSYLVAFANGPFVFLETSVVMPLSGKTIPLRVYSIGNSLSSLVSIWWEHPEIVDKLNTFRRALFVPLVEKLGYEYSESDSRDTSLLRTLAVGQASAARDEGVVKELKSRFKHYVETGDNSKIPADLQNVVFVAAVRAGGREEYDAVVKLHDNPTTPTEKLAAIAAMGASQDLELLQETLKFLSNKARDQDIYYFFRAIGDNFYGRRLLTKYFQDNYDIICKRFEGNFSFQNFVKGDLKMIESFYKDKDTSKYYLALGQALDTIRSRIAYVTRSTDDLWAWESLHGR